MDSALVFLHITAGTFALAAGGTALLAQKGAALHRMAGSVFFIAMLAMCSSAAVVAIARQQSLNLFAAFVTLYLVATAWKAAVRRDGEAGRFETIAIFAAFALAALGVQFGLTGPKGAAPFFYVFASVVALAGLLDLSVILRGGIAGAQRIARHLWRMTLAMFVATGSFFLGQAKFIPAEIRETNLHFVPPVLVVALLVFWIVRVLLTTWYRAPDAAQITMASAQERAGRPQSQG